jgi:hypothetical protein
MPVGTGEKARLAEALLPQRVIDRVLSRVVVDGDCLLSTYSPISDAGYRQVGWSGEGGVHKLLCHRVAWIAKHGPIPEGLTVHHECFNTACVNVEHLGLMETFENTRRQRGQDWPVGTCKRNHPNSELVREGRQRVCRLCRKASVDRRRVARRGGS